MKYEIRCVATDWCDPQACDFVVTTDEIEDAQSYARDMQGIGYEVDVVRIEDEQP